MTTFSLSGCSYIDGTWREGRGEAFVSQDPGNAETLWQGRAASVGDIDEAVQAARRAFPPWANASLAERLAYLRRFQAVFQQRQDEMARLLARETGKTLWDARSELAAAAAKLGFTERAYAERTGDIHHAESGGFAPVLRFRPHGVVAVYGPYNFPLHLPNGHILPALLAGNCVLFKPSELTPATAEAFIACWHEAGLPAGVVQLVQGERETGKALAAHPGLDGLFFTGSSDTGALLHRQFAETPQKILALELGGNNPLVVHHARDIAAAVYWTVQSAYLTSGQRCTCARRLIVPDGNEAFIDALIAQIARIRVGAWHETPEPFMGPLITNKEAEKLLAAQADFLAHGARALVPMQRLHAQLPYLSPGLIDVTPVAERPDKEWFGPLLQLIRVATPEAAIEEAAKTRFGLSSGIFTDDEALYHRFRLGVRAGVVNWNRPLTGSSGVLPFGGVGISGNHRPAAYFAADYCAYPVASNESKQVAIPATPSPGLGL